METAARAFGGRPDEVATARAFVRRVLDRWGFRSEDAILVVSELATNAICHAHSSFTVRLTANKAGLGVEVSDHSPALGVLQEPSRSSPNGRGLRIVDRLATAWGSRATATGGKTTWAELAALRQ